MKIAYLSTFYPYRGGIAQFNAMLYQEMTLNADVKAFNFKRLYPNFLFPGKTQYVSADDKAIPVESLRVLDSVNPFSYSATVKAIKKYKPDVLFIGYWMSFMVPAFGHVANRLKKHTTVVALLHNAIPHEAKFFDKPLTHLFLKQCHGFVVMSEAVKNDLLELKPNAEYLLKPHPVYSHFGEKLNKNEALNKLGLQQGKNTLLFFGLIRDYKGLDLLIQAMDLLDESYQLLIAGESYGSFDKYQSLIDQSKAKERIKTEVRYIADNEVPVLFSAADTLVLPYRSATQSGVIAAAYHFDLPMVATDVGGLKESIEPVGTGIIAGEATEKAIATAIQKLFSGNMLEKCRENVVREKKNLSWESFAKATLEFCNYLKTSEK